MKKVLVVLIFFGILFTSCDRNSAYNQTRNRNVAISDALQQEFTVKENEEINPLFEEGKSIKKHGVEMVENYFKNAMVKGEDGSCYYYRKQEKKGRETIVFYRNNNEKVCETEMPSKIKGGKILRFVQYKNFIFVSIDGDKLYLSAINIKDGTWENIIEGPDAMALFYRIFIYDNKFICEYDEEVIIYDLTGEKEEYLLEHDMENAEVSIQCIVDEKIYYFYGTEDGENDESERKVKCCDLNGENKKVLFQYNPSDVGYDTLRLEDQYIYLLADYTLLRIPLYGGKIEKAFNRETYFYDISDTYLFFLDESDGKVYKVKKDLSGEIILVKEPGPCNLDVPFICAGSHIMLKECDDKQEELIGDLAENELPGINIEYVNDYSWMMEEGTIEGTVEGTHLSDKQYKKYKRKIDKLK